MSALPAASNAAPADDAVHRSDEVIAGLRTGDVTTLDARLDDLMRAALPGGLAAVVEGLNRRLGALGSCASPSSRTGGTLTIVDAPCDFADGPQIVRTTWTSDGRLAGLFVLPAATTAPLPAELRDEPVVTGSPGWPLPGTLVTPAGTPPSAIAVLVHGSGPNDRDETIGPNKPFRDLAWGLGSRGVATLRYDKRTRVFGARFMALPAPTLDDEVVDDAVAALALASQRSGGKPVFVVGHSEGALLAPRIAAAATARGIAVAGVVMLAAPLTSVADLEVQQYAFVAGLPGARVSPERLEEIRSRRDHLRSLIAAGSHPPADIAALSLPDDLPASLWRDLEALDPAGTLVDQPRLPALLVFGGRDDQVPIAEMAAWQARVGERPLTRLVAFPAIDHLLIEGAGPMTPDDYARHGRVSAALLDTVAGWIREQAREH